MENREKGLLANYGGATLEEFALTVPGRKKQAGAPTPKKEESHERTPQGSRRP